MIYLLIHVIIGYLSGFWIEYSYNYNYELKFHRKFKSSVAVNIISILFHTIFGIFTLPLHFLLTQNKNLFKLRLWYIY